MKDMAAQGPRFGLGGAKCRDFGRLGQPCGRHFANVVDREFEGR